MDNYRIIKGNIFGEFLLLGVVIAMSFAGCTSVKYVPVETIRTDTISEVKTVYIEKKTREKESVNQTSDTHTTITLNDKGDTLRTDRRIILVKDRTLEKQNDSLLAMIDSLRHISRDSIQIPYPIEKPLSKWQQFKLDVGGFALGGGIALLVLFLFLLFVKVHK